MAASTAVAAAVDDADPRAPQAPHNLVVVGDYTGLTMDWEQDDAADGWTVYCDLMDGSDILSDYTTDPFYRFADLGPGEHHVGVVAWRDGVPSPGPGTFAYGTVLSLEEGQPIIPVVTELVPGVDSVSAAWTAGDAVAWDVLLLDDFGAEEQALDEIDQPRVAFAGLPSHTGYGLRVRAVSSDGVRSPWSDFYWTCTD